MSSLICLSPSLVIVRELVTYRNKWPHAPFSHQDAKEVDFSHIHPYKDLNPWHFPTQRRTLTIWLFTFHYFIFIFTWITSPTHFCFSHNECMCILYLQFLWFLLFSPFSPFLILLPTIPWHLSLLLVVSFHLSYIHNIMELCPIWKSCFGIFKDFHGIKAWD